jgi:16S rRNA (uracil1498-N3)-methyltransferase
LSVPARPRHRFALPAEQIVGDRVHFPAALAHQLRRVLRLRPGDQVRVFDGSGVEHTVALTLLRDAEALGTIEASTWPNSEPSLRITLAQALLPRERFELALQKGTEVGVARFVPLVTERSLVPSAALDAGRLTRWRRIVAEAAEQSGRVRLPELTEPLTLAETVRQCAPDPCLLAWERETKCSLQTALAELARPRPARLTLLIGPEGGFSSAEAQAARAAGARTISLGPRILRAETAGPLLAALALYQAGELEPPTDQDPEPPA